MIECWNGFYREKNMLQQLMMGLENGEPTEYVYTYVSVKEMT